MTFQANLTIFPVKSKKSERSPDNSGTLEIKESELQSFIRFLNTCDREENYKGDSVIKLSVNTWAKQMRDGRPYMQGNVKEPYKPDSNNQTQNDNMPF